MAIIHKVGKGNVGDYNINDKYYAEVFDKESVEDSNLLTVVSSINKFNTYLENEISKLKMLDDERVLKSVLDFSKRVKVEIKNIENSFESDKLKLLFNKYAVSKLGRELTAVERFTKVKIGEKKSKVIKDFLKHLEDSSRASFYDLEILNENLNYYRNYLALLIGNAPIDIEKESKFAIYSKAIDGAIEANNFIVATKLLNIDFVNSSFSDIELASYNEKILAIKNKEILNVLEAELIKINDIKIIKSKINELEKAKFISKIDADILFQKIYGNIRVNTLAGRRRYYKELTDKLLTIFNKIYSSSVDFDEIYNEVADNNIYNFILKIVDNSMKEVSQSVASEREVVFNNLLNGIRKRYIIDINALINIKDVYEKMDIVSIIKLIKSIVERDSNELNISE